MRVVHDIRHHFCRGQGHHQMAFAVAHVEQFVDVLILFDQDILADDPDVGGAVFHVGRKVHRLDDDEADLRLFIGDDQFAGILHDVFRRVPDFGQDLHRFIK